VIIPTFRRPAALLEAVASAVDQRDVSVEVLVIDDSPEASAEEAVRGLRDPRIDYLKIPSPPEAGRAWFGTWDAAGTRAVRTLSGR